MTQRKITILAPDFKPMLGGVAEYSFQLADKLNDLGILDRVITPNIQSESFSFHVSAPQDFSWSNSFKGKGLIKRKLYSLIYLFQLRLIQLERIYNWFFHRDRVFIIINWIASPIIKEWILILNFFNIQYAVILHGKDIINASEDDAIWFRNACIKARLLIFNSQATETLFHELHPEIQVKSWILYPSIDVEYLQASDLDSLKDLEKSSSFDLSGKLIISSVCRLVKRKGIHLAIEALEPILKQNKDIIYIIMGVGEEYQTLQNLISDLQLDDRVKLVGDRRDDEKFSLLSVSSIFIMPNLRLEGKDFEGFGISFLEASFFKNVVIGGRSGGVPEAIKDGHSGFLVDADSVDAVASIREVVMSLLDNPAKMNQIAEFGHKYSLENFESTVTVGNFANDIQANFLSKQKIEV